MAMGSSRGGGCRSDHELERKDIGIMELLVRGWIAGRCRWSGEVENEGGKCVREVKLAGVCDEMNGRRLSELSCVEERRRGMSWLAMVGVVEKKKKGE
ncbi:hypothetical protein CRG98_031417 [Punica granatum]|uniref:Uncharacterized protein n=1 Tax=Punica granatum TaxID=22663 RepID=A0A2I0IVX3_PUNGR|nr:hypothetical protein CRG98_031417 [Punica granatum]